MTSEQLYSKFVPIMFKYITQSVSPNGGAVRGREGSLGRRKGGGMGEIVNEGMSHDHVLIIT